jgi:hypothetical protein
MSGVRMATRVFKRNLTKHIHAWQDNALPENKIQRLNQEMREIPANFVKQTSKLGAV